MASNTINPAQGLTPVQETFVAKTASDRTPPIEIPDFAKTLASFELPTSSVVRVIKEILFSEPAPDTPNNDAQMKIVVQERDSAIRYLKSEAAQGAYDHAIVYYQETFPGLSRAAAEDKFAADLTQAMRSRSVDTSDANVKKLLTDTGIIEMYTRKAGPQKKAFLAEIGEFKRYQSLHPNMTPDQVERIMIRSRCVSDLMQGVFSMRDSLIYQSRLAAAAAQTP